MWSDRSSGLSEPLSDGRQWACCLSVRMTFRERQIETKCLVKKNNQTSSLWKSVYCRAMAKVPCELALA